MTLYVLFRVLFVYFIFCIACIYCSSICVRLTRDLINAIYLLTYLLTRLPLTDESVINSLENKIAWDYMKQIWRKVCRPPGPFSEGPSEVPRLPFCCLDFTDQG